MPRLIIVSNRLPLSLTREGGEVRLEQSAGGLATGLAGPHERLGGLWVGWPGSTEALSEDERARITRQLSDHRAVPVWLDPDDVKRFYEGYSNGVLWPLFHYLINQVPLHVRDWGAYERANRRFAEVVAAHHRPGDLVWVHDYHLMLVPQLVRELVPGARIGFFLHIPFPGSEVFRTLPNRERLLEGMLGADLVGFHTAAYMRHFASSLLRILGIAVDVDRAQLGERTVRLGVFPMGIDAARFARVAADPEVAREVSALRGSGDCAVLLAIDRLDYTKGIPRRLLAFDRLLRRHPSQQAVEGEETPRDALRVVEAVDRQQDGAVSGAAERAHFARHLGVGGHAGEPRGVDAHRKDPQADGALFQLRAVHVDRDAEDAQQRRGEVAHVRRGVEADQVGAEHALEQPLAVGQRAEDLRPREGDVQEEADARPGHQLAHELRHEHQVVVVHPDEVARPVVGGDYLCEAPVRTFIRAPVPHVQGHLVDQVVEEGPENPVRVALVEALHVAGIEPHGNGAVVRQLARDPSALVLAQRLRRARPSDPEAAQALVWAGEAGGQPTRALLEPHLHSLSRQGERESVRDDNESRHAVPSPARPPGPTRDDTLHSSSGNAIIARDGSRTTAEIRHGMPPAA